MIHAILLGIALTIPPYKIVFSDSLLTRVSSIHHYSLAYSYKKSDQDTSILYFRDSIRTWPPRRIRAITHHESFHLIPLPPKLHPYSEALANWYTWKQGECPIDPPESFQIGLASGFRKEFSQVLYPWWRVLSLVPDTSVMEWITSEKPIPEIEWRNAMEKAVKCFFNDESCWSNCPLDRVKGLPIPKKSMPNSIHFLESGDCPNLSEPKFNCLSGNNNGKPAILWYPAPIK